MIYFTADTHFGHYNVIRFCDRPFASAEEMDEAMIQNWNDRVTGNDTVYILGDMFFRSTNAEEILKRLKGKKRLIVGNHDGSWMTKFDYATRPMQRRFKNATCISSMREVGSVICAERLRNVTRILQRISARIGATKKPLL